MIETVPELLNVYTHINIYMHVYVCTVHIHIDIHIHTHIQTHICKCIDLLHTWNGNVKKQIDCLLQTETSWGHFLSQSLIKFSGSENGLYLLPVI